jgi:hypothetical protein
MSKTKLFALVVAAATLSNAAHAQGAFDFGRIPGIDAEPTVQIDLSASMLAFVSAAAGANSPGAANPMDGIEGVRVYVYESIDDIEAVHDFIDDTSGTLEREGWERTVFIQEDSEKVRIYTKLEGNRIAGLTLMVVDGSQEAVFINVAGQINPAQLAQLMGAVGMDGMLDGLSGGPAPDPQP